MNEMFILLSPVFFAVAALFGAMWIAEKRHPLKRVEEIKTVEIAPVELTEAETKHVREAVKQITGAVKVSKRGHYFHMRGRRSAGPIFIEKLTIEAPEDTKAKA
ncbi:hypothetical protein [Agrobacterium tumefaciens]|uniref:hypothetical protein n=1 Tax=Agrobacterium tumefaciens TaxID=358 RepID=UPI001FA96641|nr:hypothetical protein [Agrobacterium tumefaciens]UNZ49312.1 hypothetical protein MLE07_07895 [Agrobacterium tumefaciens]